MTQISLQDANAPKRHATFLKSYGLHMVGSLSGELLHPNHKTSPFFKGRWISPSQICTTNTPVAFSFLGLPKSREGLDPAGGGFRGSIQVRSSDGDMEWVKLLPCNTIEMVWSIIVMDCFTDIDELFSAVSRPVISYVDDGKSESEKSSAKVEINCGDPENDVGCGCDDLQF